MNKTDISDRFTQSLRQQHKKSAKYVCHICSEEECGGGDDLLLHIANAHPEAKPITAADRGLCLERARQRGISSKGSKQHTRHHVPVLRSSPNRDVSVDSFKNNAEASSISQTPHEVPASDPSAMQIERLSLEQSAPHEVFAESDHARSATNNTSSPSKKRPASSDFSRPPLEFPSRQSPVPKIVSRQSKRPPLDPALVRKQKSVQHEIPRPRPAHRQLFDPNAGPQASSTLEFANPHAQHSVTVAASDTPPPPPPAHGVVDAKMPTQQRPKGGLLRLPVPLEPTSHEGDEIQMIKQPDSYPISNDQLICEVEGIYTTLEIVEKKCIEEDTKLMTVQGRKAAPPTPEKWRSLTTLHRTLLYEHHDFLLASQHPIADEQLKGLASQRQMPLRMWKYAIHAFLEVLRQQLPESLEFMINFVYLSYQMMALLFETVPHFEDVWTECLGDLARYRMAIENRDMRDREVWGGVARYWYSKASDRQPLVGRLYHHLGILVRPNAVQQLFYYCKSLTCVHPFWNAKESIKTVFDPTTSRSSSASSTTASPSDSAFIRAHAVMFNNRQSHEVRVARDEFVVTLSAHIESSGPKWKESGMFMAIANTSAWMQYGMEKSTLRVWFSVLNMGELSRQATTGKLSVSVESWMHSAAILTFDTLNATLSRVGDRNVLPHVHIVLAFVKSLLSLSPFEDLISMIKHILPWAGLASFLNRLCQLEGMEDRVVDAGLQQRFPVPERGDPSPLPEDYLIRGLIWSGSYFPTAWFPTIMDEESRLIELASTSKLRAERVLWLAISLSKRLEVLTYDRVNKVFCASCNTAAHTGKLRSEMDVEPPTGLDFGPTIK